MLKSRFLMVRIEELSDGLFFIYVKDENGSVMSPSEWKRHLFLWHKESFYGTTLTPSTFQNVEGITLNSWELLTLFAVESFSSLIQWDWDENGQLFLAAALTMHDTILNGIYSPNFLKGEITNIRWELPQVVIDDFNESFWQQKHGEKTVRSTLEKWFHFAMTYFLKTNSEVYEKVLELTTSTLTENELTSYFNKSRFQEWLGLKSIRPFTIGLRLTEPIDDDASWQLETILRDVHSPERIFSIHERKRIPMKWKAFLRDIQEEQERWMKLFPWLSGSDDVLINELDDERAWEFLTDASEKLLLLGVEILLPSWWVSMREAQLTVKAKIRQTNTSYRPSFVGLNAMVDFDWRLSLNGSEMSEEEFNQLLESKRKLIKWNGQWVRLDPKMIKQLQGLMNRAKKEGLRVRDIFTQELVSKDDEIIEEFDPRVFANIKIELNRSLKNLVGQLTNIKNIPENTVPRNFQGTLRPYQQQGYDWLTFLRGFGFGAVLADDMGLGKTIQLITYLLHVKNTKTSSAPALIICPTSVLGNWQKELDRFAPDLKVMLHYGPNRTKGEIFSEVIQHADVVLTSYGLSHLDFEELSNVNWGTIALDEAQNIKNAETKQSRAIRKLQGDHQIALTGTPMENRLSELWSIFDFTNHGFLGTFSGFQKSYIVPIEKDGSQEKVQELQSLIRPFLLRRTKKDPEVELNLPDKLEQKEYCPLTAEQASLYEQLIRETFSQIETLTGFERKGLILQMLNRLKQLCNHPALYLKEEEPHDLESRSHKLEKLTELLESVLDAKEACLIFTQYLGMGHMIQETLKKRFNLMVPFLNGSMPKTKRDQYVEQFQNGEFPIFLISLKAGGTGLNLTAANHVIHYDRWWNPAVENQATDRAYRIGQNRFVHVHKFITTGTLEEKIDAMLEKKQALNDEIIQSDNWITELSDLELQNLLTLA